jgi:predicted phage terminase large subunit-like protein
MNEFWVLDVIRTRESSAQIERLIKSAAEIDGHDVEIWMEQEPGASGKALISHYRRNILAGYTFRRDLPSGKKDVRARPVSAAAEEGAVHVLLGSWNLAWYDELSNYPDSLHDDQVDSLSGAHNVAQKVQRLGDQHKKGKSSSGYSR